MTPRSHRLTSSGCDDGFIIVAVLWILAALATLAGIYAFYARTGVVSARVSGERLQAESIVTSALELTALRLMGRGEDDPRSVGDFRFSMGGADAVVHFETEGGRIDLNAASKELLAGLFLTLGAKPDDAAAYADRIVGWRKKPEAGDQNKELGLYKDAGLRYGPRQASFQTITELRFVLGISPEVADAALPFLTVFNGMPQIDVIAAAPEIVRSLPHLEPDAAATVLDKRGALDPKSLMSLLGRARDSVSLEPRKSSRVRVALSYPTGRQVNAEAVILLIERDKQPYRILSWRDDFDGAL